MNTQKFVEEFKKNNPIVECSGHGPAWKWRRYLDGIDLRYGCRTKKAAEMERAKAAKEAAIIADDYETPIPCPKCGKQTKRDIINYVGTCLDCAEGK